MRLFQQNEVALRRGNSRASIAICGQKRRELATLAFEKQRNRDSAEFPNGSQARANMCD